ncbi:MAG: dTDP-glucose 4,6-dehydratase [Luteolibacter sp.]
MKSDPLRILVTGGAGFIGCNLVRQLLLETEHVVINYDKLTYAGNLRSLEEVLEHPRHHFRRGDVCDAEALGEVFREYRPQAVIHLAAESHVDRSIDGPAVFLRTNVMGTGTLLQVALEHWRALEQEERERFRFLHISSDEVYGSLETDAPGFSESSPYAPRSPYSASKAAADHLVRAWGTTYGLPVLITNCSNNYGPYQFPEKLIPVVILKCLRGEPIPVYGKGENARDWLHVSDHCRALLAVLEKGNPGETYNIGGNEEHGNIELVRGLCRILDRLKPGTGPYESLIAFVEDRPGHDLRYAIDFSKITRELGWAPGTVFSEGLERTVRWYLERTDWWREILEGNYRMDRLGMARRP